MKILYTTLTMLFLCVNASLAQSFNTINGLHSRYKIERVVTPINEEEEQSEDSTSTVALPTDSIPLPTPASQKTIALPFSVSYPLRQSKLVVTSPYGWRIHPIHKTRRFHAGVDLRAHYEPVYAMLLGVVINTGYEPKGGNFISLRHGAIKVTYCHLSCIGVSKGATVYAGQPIGVSGNSGKTSGPHLHLGVRDMNTNCPISAKDLLTIIDKYKRLVMK